MVHAVGVKASAFVEEPSQIDERCGMNSGFVLESHSGTRGAVEHPLGELEAGTIRLVFDDAIDDHVLVPRAPSADDQAPAVESDPAIREFDDLAVVGTVAWASTTINALTRASAACWCPLTASSVAPIASSRASKRARLATARALVPVTLFRPSSPPTTASARSRSFKFVSKAARSSCGSSAVWSPDSPARNCATEERGRTK